MSHQKVGNFSLKLAAKSRVRKDVYIRSLFCWLFILHEFTNLLFMVTFLQVSIFWLSLRTSGPGIAITNSTFYEREGTYLTSLPRNNCYSSVGLPSCHSPYLFIYIYIYIYQLHKGQQA